MDRSDGGTAAIPVDSVGEIRGSCQAETGSGKPTVTSAAAELTASNRADDREVDSNRTMNRTHTVIAVVSIVLILGGSGAVFLLVPPSATGTPATQPYRIEPDAPATNYRVVANLTMHCRNATRSARVSMQQVAHVNTTADARRSHRIVRTGNRTFTDSVYRNGSTRYRRSTGGSTSPTYEREGNAGSVGMALQRYLPVFPRLLRYEWRAVSNGSGRTVFRPRQGYWVAPATNYGVRHRLFVASTAGRLVTTTDGVLVELGLDAETVSAANRYHRYVRPRDRCSVTLSYRYGEASGPVETPAWVATARDRT